MEPGPDSLPWEGLQGTDSFFPYRVGGTWHALYGSAKSETMPITHWLVGLASAPALGGPWTRVRAHSPVPIEPKFIENPIVTAVPGGGWLAVYDSQGADTIGWAYSADGIAWGAGHAPEDSADRRRVGEGRADTARAHRRRRRAIHRLLHRLRAGSRLGAPAARRRTGDVRHRLRGVAAGVGTQLLDVSSGLALLVLRSDQ